MSEFFKFNEANYNYVFHSWEGPVGREIAARAETLKTKAIASSGVKSGALKASISTYFTHHGTELEARVGANPTGDRVGYALYHHEGTGPHIIRGKPGKGLYFETKTGSVLTPLVNHPGTRSNPYLTKWLGEAV